MTDGMGPRLTLRKVTVIKSPSNSVRCMSTDVKKLSKEIRRRALVSLAPYNGAGLLM